MPKRLYITLGIIAVGAVLLTWYANLGGFEDPKIERIDKKEVWLVGKSYQGISTDKELRTLLGEIHRQIEEGRIKGTMSVVYFGNPDQDSEPIKIFVGAESENEISEVPSGLETKKIDESKVARATINAYSVVSPNPDKVNQMLRESLEGSGYTFSNIYMERYISKEEIWTEIYLKEGQNTGANK